jgi:4-aminobutyrate aminotransferase/(S)-3-amino-2-methylpropionate transaminase
MSSEETRSPLGQDEPAISVRPPGPASLSWLARHAHVTAPMGPSASERGGVRAPASAVVYATAQGSNVTDVDGNRYGDFAAGFGAMLLGHGHPNVLRVLELQAARLLQALGDVHPADAKIALCERLTQIFPEANARVILGQSGADAVTAALKTALLFTGKPGVIAFRGGYHGLSYAPLAACGLRESYRAPFASQLNPHVTFLDYPATSLELTRVLEQASLLMREGSVGAVLVEPILGRGGVVVPPASFLPELAELARGYGALLIADEIWTGLGRSGKMLFSCENGLVPDLVCLGKGLGGGLPVSALIGRHDVMSAWRREAEVVHTSTFAGAPLACATALATLDVLAREHLAERARALGQRFRELLEARLSELPSVKAIRGSGFMIAVDLGARAGSATALCRALLERGYITSTGGGQREVLVLTPALNIGERLLFGFIEPLTDALATLPS